MNKQALYYIILTDMLVPLLILDPGMLSISISYYRDNNHLRSSTY